jgi:hypothetical protein
MRRLSRRRPAFQGVAAREGIKTEASETHKLEAAKPPWFEELLKKTEALAAIKNCRVLR